MTRTVSVNGSVFTVVELGLTYLPKEVDPIIYSKYERVYGAFIGGNDCYFVICRGYLKSDSTKAKKEVHVYYPNGKMWYSYGHNFASAIEGAMKDAWKYIGG